MNGVQRGLDVHVLDQVTDGPKPDLVSDLGATYHYTGITDVTRNISPDVVIEATGVGALIFGAAERTAQYGIVCLTGVSPAGHPMSVEAGTLNRDLVLENDVIIGSVNANLDHYADAATALADADLPWLKRLITRRVPIDDFEAAFDRRDDDIKVTLTFGDSA
jgi:threonine dehydrogenase-like Zn-dependent dehydrogenase